MNQDAIDKLDEIIAFNSRMIKAAEAGNWDVVTDSEKLRQQLIKAFYSQTPPVTDEAVLSHATQELLDVNEKLKQLAIQARDNVKTELNDLTKGREAVSAYTKYSR